MIVTALKPNNKTVNGQISQIKRLIKQCNLRPFPDKEVGEGPTSSWLFIDWMTRRCELRERRGRGRICKRAQVHLDPIR